jgi:lambda repressor-like predicted transcriptional regulator
LNDSTDFNRWHHARILARVIARGRGVWTLAEASVECRVMSGATTAGADETS